MLDRYLPVTDRKHLLHTDLTIRDTYIVEIKQIISQYMQFTLLDSLKMYVHVHESICRKK